MSYLETKSIDEAFRIADNFLLSKSDKEDYETFHNWHINVKIIFFRHLLNNLDKIDRKIYETILTKLELDKTNNPEILCLWYQITLKKGFLESVEKIGEYLGSHGRIKYVKYVYVDLFKIDKNAALKIYIKNKNKYNKILNNMLESSFEKIDTDYRSKIEYLQNLLRETSAKENQEQIPKSEDLKTDL